MAGTLASPLLAGTVALSCGGNTSPSPEDVPSRLTPFGLRS